MKISFDWLKRYVDLPVEPEALLEVLPKIGFEVDSMERTGLPQLESIVVGEVLTRDKHPDADKLSVCTVTVGEGDPINIVCGADNCDAGNRVIVAQVGARMPEGFKIKRSKLRGVPSEGMLCSARELGLGQDYEGIYILDQGHPLGTPINDVFPGGDVIFDLEITANRGDCLSHIGIARELAAYYDLPVKHPECKSVAGKGEALLQNLEVTAPDCPYYTAWSVQGVRQGTSPDWMQKDLEAIGLRPVNLIVDIVNWVMFETGQPMHAFDAKKIRGASLMVRKAKAGETITTLDEKKRTLDESMLVIADAERSLVVAGVMGSLDAEVDDSTTDVILESAYFDPASIRQTARTLNISTDSSYRFERDVDPAGVYPAAQRAVDLILELSGGTLAKEPQLFGGPPLEPVSIAITGGYVRELLGFDIGDEAIESIWKRLGFSVERDDAQSWNVAVPSYRREVTRPVDLVEEVVRLFGTDKIEASSVTLPAVHRKDDPVATFNREVASYFVSQGADECCHYTMRSGEELKQLFGDTAEAALRLHNPLASDQGHLRPSLIPGLLDALQYNIHHGNDVRRLFEQGHVFLSQGKAIEERIACAFVFLAEPLERTWMSEPPLDFYAAKNFLERTLPYAGVDVARLTWEPLSEVLWQDGHAAQVNHPKYALRAGLLDLALLKDRWGLRSMVYAGEFTLSPQILGKLGKVKTFESFSAFPPVTRDIALLVDAALPVAKVEKDLLRVAEAAAKKVFSLESVNIFDVYSGEGLPSGKKSLGFELSFRSQDRTLKDAEVSAVFDAIQKEITASGAYTVRDNA